MSLFSLQVKGFNDLIVSKLSDQISVRFPAEIRAALMEIEARHGITSTVFIRRMVEAGINLYRTQGSFSFPIKVVPESAPPPPKFN